MHSAQSVVILPANIQNPSSSYVVNNPTEIYQQHQQQFNNKLQPLIILSTPNSTSFQSISISNLNPTTNGQIQPQPHKPTNKPTSSTVKRQQPIKPKLKPALTPGDDVHKANNFNSLPTTVEGNKQLLKISPKLSETTAAYDKVDDTQVLTAVNKKKRAAPSRAATTKGSKSKILKTENLETSVNSPPKKPTKKSSNKKSKCSQEKPTSESKKSTSENSKVSPPPKKSSAISSKPALPRTQFSQTLFG